MTGIAHHNFPLFNRWARTLRAAGFDVANPAENGSEPSLSWEQYLRADIKSLCDCDTLAYLPGWEASKGAMLEMHIAHRVGIRIVDVEKLIVMGDFVKEGEET